ncbi:MAG: ribosomal RNA small subunit methyltransferase A [Candidatus Omnitrophica bacterium]|nr:ribosomal RNA small subunit methyltransferase A [Candidatus Omnitrophota bacterium]
MVKPRPKKFLGQNFLTSKTTAVKIVDALDIQAGDIVLEIGPGHGVLTDIILERCADGEINYIVIEKDRTLINALEGKNDAPWFNVICSDIMRFDFASLNVPEKKKIKVIGNIPYNITSDILFLLVRERALIDTAVLTVQREVVDRIIAPPGSRTYGRLSVMMQFYAMTQPVLTIKPGAFYPRPKVNSKVVRLVFKDKICFTLENKERLFEAIVRHAFSSRRKKVINNLKERFDYINVVNVIEDVLHKNGLSLSARAEELSVPVFVELTERCGEIGCTA